MNDFLCSESVERQKAEKGSRMIGNTSASESYSKTIMSSSSLGSTCYAAFVVASILVLKTVNEIVTEPYMVSKHCHVFTKY